MEKMLLRAGACGLSLRARRLQLLLLALCRRLLLLLDGLGRAVRSLLLLLLLPWCPPRLLLPLRPGRRLRLRRSARPRARTSCSRLLFPPAPLAPSSEGAVPGIGTRPCRASPLSLSLEAASFSIRGASATWVGPSLGPTSSTIGAAAGDVRAASAALAAAAATLAAAAAWLAMLAWSDFCMTPLGPAVGISSSAKAEDVLEYIFLSPSVSTAILRQATAEETAELLGTSSTNSVGGSCVGVNVRDAEGEKIVKGRLEEACGGGLDWPAGAVAEEDEESPDDRALINLFISSSLSKAAGPGALTGLLLRLLAKSSSSPTVDHFSNFSSDVASKPDDHTALT